MKNNLSITDLATFPATQALFGRPFGLDDHDQPIAQVAGAEIVRLIKFMSEQIGSPAEQVPPPFAAALDELVIRINAAITDPRFHVSTIQLLDPAQNYSHEFWLLVGELARDLTNDDQFFFI